MELDLTGLNKKQYESVITTTGPVMVMAGAGSGKTKVLTTRIAFLLNVLKVKESNILAVTFTNKAANEMKERIFKMTNISPKHMWISTFHAFCAKFLRFEIDKLEPYNHNFTIIDDDDSIKIIRDILKDFNLDYRPKQIYNMISKTKNNTFIDYYDEKNKIDFNKINDEYDKRLKKDNLLDFDDLILKTIEILTTKKEVLEKYQNKFEYILVDEFQDTNLMQYKLLRLLADKYKNIFVVGDDFQSIYSFRGAEIKNINRFREDYKNHTLILLEENYRSTPDILNLANDVISKNKNQIKKVMFSTKDSYKLPVLYSANNEYEEVEYVIDNIKKLMLSGQNYNQFAIMYRNNSTSRIYENRLISEKMPYVIYGGISFYQRKEIKDLIAYFRLILHNDDDFSFKRIVNEPKRKIGEVIISKLTSISLEKEISLFDSIDYYNGSGIGYTNLKNFKNIISSIKANLDNILLSDLIDILDKEIGYIAEIKRVEDEDTYNDRLSNIKELKSILRELEESDIGTNEEILDNFLSDLALKTNNDDNNDGNSIILTTYHQAKGLEFDNVFMVSNEDGIFPSQASYESPKDLEEERRIFYVGVTRAKKRLFITYAKERMHYGHRDLFFQSDFISDLDKSLYEDYNEELRKKFVSKYYKKKEEPKEVKEEIKEPVTYNTGDKVNHDKYGDGIIVNLSGNIATIAFSVEYGIKKIKADYQGLKKK